MDALLWFCVILLTTWLSIWIPTTLILSTDLAFALDPTDSLLLIDLAVFWKSTNLLFSKILVSTTPLLLILVKLTDLTNMTSRKCCIRFCHKRRSENVSLHRFPNPETDIERFEAWRNAIGGDVMVTEKKSVYRLYRVCDTHFDRKFKSVRGRVTYNAVPTLFLTGSSSLSRQPIAEVTNRVYSRLSSSRISTENMPSTSSTSDHLIPGAQQPVAFKPDQQLDVMKQQFLQEPKKNKFVPADVAALHKKIKILQQSKETYKSKLRRALKLSENPTFLKALKKFSTFATIFTMLQFREAGKPKMGRRYTKEEKVMALSLYKQGPRAYRFFKRKGVILPSALTLSRMVTIASIKPGINKNLFHQLKKRVDKMSSTDKLCLLLFDEIAIAPHFDYNQRTDEISGFVNNGEIKKSQIADHALVFMIRGLHKNYKQPIAYSFSAGTTPATDIVVQIKNVTQELQSIGLKVVATICDQGTTNVSAINWLVKETKEEYLKKGEIWRNHTFEINGEEVVPVYDTPHLMKGIRNNLINKNLKAVIQGKPKTAKWEHIVLLYNENPAYQGIRLMPKLTENHVIPKKISKMKVKCATQVFSRSVAANMGYLSHIGILPKECEETADIIIFFDNLFDSLNGSFVNYKKRTGKPLLGAVTPSSPHKKIWIESKKVLSTMKFIEKNRPASVPSLKNWVQTIENIEYIVDVLEKKYKLTSLWMRHLNQDPLENFFGSIRSHGYRNNMPTCAGFQIAFASLLINNLSSVHSPGANCEDDDCKVFKTLGSLFFTKQQVPSNNIELDFDDISDDVFVPLEEKRKNPKIRAQLEYVTGYVLKKIFKKKCEMCKASLYDRNKESVIKMREYFSNKKCLTYPSQALLKCFSNIQDVVIKIIQKDSKKKNIRQYIKTVLTVMVDYNFIKCNEHKNEITQKLENVSINLFIYFRWCKDINKIIKGSRSDYDQADKMQCIAYNYAKKRFRNRK